MSDENEVNFHGANDYYKKELEEYGAKLCDKYRSVVKELSQDKEEKLGWVPDMAHLGLTKEYDGLECIKRYMDLWHLDEDMNKAFFKLDEELIEKSHKFHQKILQLIFESDQISEYVSSGTGDFVNSLDYQLITETTKDTRKDKIEKIMDFGAGYGREANLFTQHPDCKEYTIVEAIEDSYVVQSAYMKMAADKILNNYVFHESLLGDLNFTSDTKKLNHLLTFDMDLIPDEYFDLIICSNVLNEITEDAFVYVIKQIERTLKKGGILYIKDHRLGDQCGHQYYDYDVLESLNFALEYRPFVEDFKDIWTVPRIYRKYGDNKPSFLTPVKYVRPLLWRQKKLKNLLNGLKRLTNT